MCRQSRCTARSPFAIRCGSGHDPAVIPAILGLLAFVLAYVSVVTDRDSYAVAALACVALALGMIGAPG